MLNDFVLSDRIATTLYIYRIKIFIKLFLDTFCQHSMVVIINGTKLKNGIPANSSIIQRRRESMLLKSERS